jgi:hypothetical protein
MGIIYDKQQGAGFEAEETVQVLGMTIGMPGKGPSNNEMERLAAAGRKADELSTLPIRADLKQRLAATVVAPTATWGFGIWGFGIGGCWPNKSETKNFLMRFDLSTKCPQFPAGRSSKPLRQVFFLGHVSDLLFQAVARMARASFQWHLLRAKHGHACAALARQWSKWMPLSTCCAYLGGNICLTSGCLRTESIPSWRGS